jgi:hypothetical protein
MFDFFQVPSIPWHHSNDTNVWIVNSCMHKLMPHDWQLGPYIVAHCQWWSILFFFIHSHMFSNSSSLFILMPNIIWSNINTMGVKRHRLICLFMSFWWVGKLVRKKVIFLGKKWSSYAWKWGSYFKIFFWNSPMMTMQRIMKNLPYISSLNFFVIGFKW